jgi:hypothetical protein
MRMDIVIDKYNNNTKAEKNCKSESEIRTFLSDL